jgi:prepilin-type N-terminal cleavage/methylation domain-containing protein
MEEFFMQKRKGFTLVELVIVIAVIAILAGVLIGTFASVLSKAQETARLQQIKADEHDQKANDLLKKIEDSNWYGWEDFETSIVEKITNAIASAKPGTVDVKLDSQAVSKAVSEAMSKYYAEHAMGNTSLTEEQVKAIIENALGSFKFESVTKAQVETIVNTAVGKMTTGLTAAQVQKIVNAAADRVEAGQLTAGQITTIVGNALATCKADLATADKVDSAVSTVVQAIKDKEVSTLTAKQVEEMLNAALAKAGNTSWIKPETYATEDKFVLETADDVQGLATLVNGGYDFEDKVIELPTTVDFTGKEFVPIGNTRGSEFKGTLGGTATQKTTITGLTLEQEFNAIIKGYLINCSSTGQMDKVGVGFVAYLGEGATLQNIDFVGVNVDIKTTNINGVYFDGVSVGVAVGMLDGGTIENVNVVSGTIKSVYRVAGLVGAARCGTIKNCTIGTSEAAVTIESTAKGAKWYDADNTHTYLDVTSTSSPDYCAASGLIGYLRNFVSKDPADKTNVTVSGVTIYATVKGLVTNKIAAEYSNANLNGVKGDANVTTGVDTTHVTLTTVS